MGKLRDLKAEIEGMNLSSLLTDTLPPIPEWVNKRLGDMGGRDETGKNKYRMISGLDPKQQEFAFGEWHRKYVSVRDTVTEISAVKTIAKSNFATRLWSTNDAIEKGFLNDKGQVTAWAKKHYTVILMQSEEVIEYGIPRYIIERFKPAEEFGTPEEWEEHRWIRKNEKGNSTGKDIDIYGEFPREGRYEFFCNYEDGLQGLEGEINETTFKEISENGINQIQDLIDMAQLPAIEVLENIIAKADEKAEKAAQKFDEEIEYGIKENAGRLTNMPTVGYGD